MVRQRDSIELWERSSIKETFTYPQKKWRKVWKKYFEYYNKFRPHKGLKGLTPYKKLKGLQGASISKDFKASNIYPPVRAC